MLQVSQTSVRFKYLAFVREAVAEHGVQSRRAAGEVTARDKRAAPHGHTSSQSLGRVADGKQHDRGVGAFVART